MKDSGLITQDFGKDTFQRRRNKLVSSSLMKSLFLLRAE